MKAIHIGVGNANIGIGILCIASLTSQRLYSLWIMLYGYWTLEPALEDVHCALVIGVAGVKVSRKEIEVARCSYNIFIIFFWLFCCWFGYV